MNFRLLSGLRENSDKFAYVKNCLRGKRVLVFDTETTGLLPGGNARKDFADNNVYDNCRIIEISYYYTDRFGCDDLINIHNYFRKPDSDNFVIQEGAAAVHGIKMETLIEKGLSFPEILDMNLGRYIANAQYIISHNIDFDVNVLLNELHRVNCMQLIQTILNLKKYYRLFCTCLMTKFTKLSKLYEDKFEKQPDIAHRAYGDVLTLLELINGEVIANFNIIGIKE